MDVVIATEDDLSEVVLRKILFDISVDYNVHTSLGKVGFGYLKQKIVSFNKMAKFMPVIVLADLDRAESREALLESWLPGEKSDGLVFAVAVREVESWIMADSESFSDFLGVSKTVIPRAPDSIEKAKWKLLEVVGRSTKRTIKDEILPKRGSTSPVGLGYNENLSKYVLESWSLERARAASPSLGATFDHLLNLKDSILFN